MRSYINKLIVEQFNLNILNEQHYSWGGIYWLDLGSKSQVSVSVAISYPNMEQKLHSHPGYEEILIGLQGESIHWCNGEEKVLSRGKLIYIPDGRKHSIINKSGRNCIFISIVNPTCPVTLRETPKIDDIEFQDIADLVNLDAIVEKFSRTVNLAVSLIDPKGKLLTEHKNFPEFCKLCMKNKLGDCLLCTNGKHKNNYSSLIFFKCKFSVYSIQSPIVINDKILGFFGCGYGRVSIPTENDKILLRKAFNKKEFSLAQLAYVNLNMINLNHLKAAAETLLLVSDSLVEMLVQSARVKQINTYKLSLAREKQRKAELENSLNEAKLKFLESQVNPHFLFNALNTVAQTSLMEGATTASSITYALSNLLRRSLGKADSMITIKEELSHIKDYLLIQKYRFPDRFDVKINIESQVMSKKIPFMTLMILVENSLIHGFKDIEWKGLLCINGKIKNNELLIEVIDNGVGIDSNVVDIIQSLKTTNFKITSFKGIGLKNVYKRLEYYYGNDFKFDVEKLPEKGTKATIILPL